MTVFKTDDIETIKGLLEGKIFDGDGLAFDLTADVGSFDDFTSQEPLQNSFLLYRPQDENALFYDADGNEIGEVYVVLTQYEREPVGIEIVTREEQEAQWDYTHADASELLGAEVRLPVSRVEGYEPPRFRLVDVMLPAGAGSGDELHHYRLAEIVYIGKNRDEAGSLFRIYIERAREDDAPQWQTIFPGSYETREVEGTVVYVITEGIYGAVVYTWQYGGLVYSLNGAPLDERQAIEMISGMVTGK